MTISVPVFNKTRDCDVCGGATYKLDNEIHCYICARVRYPSIIPMAVALKEADHRMSRPPGFNEQQVIAADTWSEKSEEVIDLIKKGFSTNAVADLTGIGRRQIDAVKESLKDTGVV